LQLLELGADRPPALVKIEHAVDGARRLRSATRERGPDGVGVAADQPNVENAGS